MLEIEWEHVAGPFNRLTEGPVWDGQRILFTHIPASRIMAYDPVTSECTTVSYTHLTLPTILLV